MRRSPAGKPISTAAPASTASPTPPGALYYDGFERGTFLDDREWSTVGRDAWRLTDDTAGTIRSSDLANDGSVPYDSNVTLSYGDPDFAGGSLVLSVLASVELPINKLSRAARVIGAREAAVDEGGEGREKQEEEEGGGWQ